MENSMHLKITGLIVCLLLLTGCSKPVSEYQNLSEKPPVSITPYNTPIDESIVSTRLSIPLNDLRKRLEADIPVSLYNDPGAVKEKCIRIFGKNLCESYQVGGSVQRTGSVQLTPLNSGVLRITVPLQYKLEAKGNGKIVRELLRNIDFKTAAFTATADLKLNVNSQWQFQLDAKSSLKWNQSPKIRVLGVELDIQSKVEKPILKALDKVLKKQQSKMAANTSLKDRVENFWLSLQQPRKLNGPFQLWVKANPKTLSLSTTKHNKICTCIN